MTWMQRLSEFLAPEGERLALSARKHAVSQEDGPPPGRSGYVTSEDLAATQHRIRTGMPAAPMVGWRW